MQAHESTPVIPIAYTLSRNHDVMTVSEGAAGGAGRLSVASVSYRELTSQEYSLLRNIWDLRPADGQYTCHQVSRPCVIRHVFCV